MGMNTALETGALLRAGAFVISSTLAICLSYWLARRYAIPFVPSSVLWMTVIPLVTAVGATRSLQVCWLSRLPWYSYVGVACLVVAVGVLLAALAAGVWGLWGVFASEDSYGVIVFLWFLRPGVLMAVIAAVSGLFFGAIGILLEEHLVS